MEYQARLEIQTSRGIAKCAVPKQVFVGQDSQTACPMKGREQEMNQLEEIQDSLHGKTLKRDIQQVKGHV